MQIVLNGRETELADGTPLLGLLESKDISAEAVVVELNREIVPADAFGDITLNDGDHLEVLRFVGGG